MSDLSGGPVWRAFHAFPYSMFTGLSTGMVDNRNEPSRDVRSLKEGVVMPQIGARYLRLAQRVLARGKLPVLLMAVARKNKRSATGGLQDNLKLMLGLCSAWWRGEYRAINGRAFLAVVAALVYFLMPLDTVPDWLLGVGLLDDLAVLSWVMRTWSRELEAYRSWRDTQPVEKLQKIEALPSDH